MLTIKIKTYALIIVSVFVSTACHSGNLREERHQETHEELSLPLVKQQTSVGSMDSITTPWVPVTVSASGGEITISCWGRDYIFESSILPSQIISQGEPLLSRPIEANLMINSKPVQWQPADIEVTAQSDAAVELVGRMVSKGLDREVSLSSSIQIEYDGLMTVSISIEDSNSGQLNAFNLDIPYRAANASYYFKWVKNKRQGKHSGAIPNGNGSVMRSVYAPYFWTGDNKKGLFWFSESKVNWPNADQKNAVQYIRAENEIIQQFNLGSTREFTFGLQATPVKPLPSDWREWRLSPAPKSNIVILWGSPGKPSSVKYHSWPEATDPSVFKERVAKHHSRGQKVLSYASITRIAASCPVFQRNKSKWQEGKIRVKTKWGELVYIDPTSSEYINTIVKYFVDYMNEYDLDGYYLDGGGLYPYWQTSEGKPYYNILAYRELQKALYTALKASNPNSILITHMSADMNIPVLAYSDIHLNGEQFRYKKEGKLAFKAENSYMDAVSLPQFRAEFMGKQWGFIPFFLPEVSPESKNSLQPTEGLASLLLIHDVQPWAVNSNPSVWKKMYQGLDEFGFQDSQFIPYYGSQSPAESSMEDVYASAYKKDNGEVLLIVSNLSRVTQTGDISLNLLHLGINEIKSVYSVADKSAVTHSGNTINVALPPSSYRLLWLNKRSTP